MLSGLRPLSSSKQHFNSRSGVMNMIECLFSQDVDLKPFIGRGAGGGITFSILSRTIKRVHIQF